MKACVIMALVACSLLLSGCVFVKIKDDGSGSSKGERVAGNGVITEKTFDVASFSNIKLSVPADVTFETAPDCAVTVKMDENLFEYLTVDVVNGVLKIGSTSPSFRKFKKLAMTITAPGLAYLECNGAVDFEALDGIREGFAQGKTILLASHFAQDIDELCDSVHEMDQGIITMAK